MSTDSSGLPELPHPPPGVVVGAWTYRKGEQRRVVRVNAAGSTVGVEVSDTGGLSLPYYVDPRNDPQYKAVLRHALDISDCCAKVAPVLKAREALERAQQELAAAKAAYDEAVRAANMP